MSINLPSLATPVAKTSSDSNVVSTHVEEVNSKLRCIVDRALIVLKGLYEKTMSSIAFSEEEAVQVNDWLTLFCDAPDILKSLNATDLEDFRRAGEIDSLFSYFLNDRRFFSCEIISELDVKKLQRNFNPEMQEKMGFRKD